MAKKITEEVQYYNIKEDHSLMLNSRFVYDVEIYRVDKPYCLNDSKYIATSEWVSNSRVRFKKDGLLFWTVSTLVAAPKEWLESKNYSIKTN